MAIDPVTGIAMGAIQAAANAKTKSDYDKKLKAITSRHSETIAVGNVGLHAQAVARTGGQVPLGWLYSGSVGSYCIYYTKSEYLDKIMLRDFMYDKALHGWNPAWGDLQTEYAKAKRKSCAEQNPANAEQILSTPLENFRLEVRHLESYFEMQERKQKEWWENYWRSLGEISVGFLKFCLVAGIIVFVVRFTALLLFGV